MDPAERAGELFRAGNEKFDAGDLGEAERLYEEAWALQKSFDLAANLGAVKLELGKAVEGAEYLSFAMASFPAGGDADKRSALAKRLEQAAGQVGAIRIAVEPADARILIDGQPRSPSPYRQRIFLEPGQHELRVEKEGYRPLTRGLPMSIGQELPLKVELEVAEDDASVPPPELPPDQGDAAAAGGAPVWPVFVGAGVSAALLGIGVGFTVAGASSASDADSQRDALSADNVSCPGGCTELRDAYADADGLYNTGVAFFVAGGATALATVAYALLRPTGGAAEMGGVEADFEVAPSRAALSIRTRF